MVDTSIRKKTRDDVHATVASIVLHIAGKPQESELQPHWPLGMGCGFGKNAPHTKELGLDAIDHVEIIMATETALGIKIPDCDTSKIISVIDLVNVACRCAGVEQGEPA
jgi:hypothetical protein